MLNNRPPPVLPAKNSTTTKRQPSSLPDNHEPTPNGQYNVMAKVDCDLPAIGPSHLKHERMYRIRDKVAQEVLSTEKSYVESLNVMCDVWYEGLLKSDVLTQEQMEKLFSNIAVIRNFNRTFCDVLGDRLKNWENSTTLADIFVKHGPFFRMYTQYVLNHDNAVVLLAELNNMSKFQRVCDTIGMDIKVKGLELSSYLIMPIQRIPRYKLLLTELQKNTPSNHGDIAFLTSALDIIGQVAMSVNNAIKNYENKSRIIAIQQQFVGKVEFVVPFRTFVRQGPLTKKCRSTDVVYEFILFSDLLLYAAYTAVSKSYRLHRLLPITSQFTIAELPDLGEERNRFSISSVDKSFIVLAATPEAKQEWLVDLNRCIADQKLRIKKEQGTKENYVAPVWQGDSSSRECSRCNVGFSILKRRHHCRKCGFLVCNDCSKERVHGKRYCDECVRTNRPSSESVSYSEDSFSRPSYSIMDEPHSPGAEYSRIDSINESAPALNPIVEDNTQNEEDETSCSTPPPAVEDIGLDASFPVYATTANNSLQSGFSLYYQVDSNIRAYVVDKSLNLGLGKLETDDEVKIGLFRLTETRIGDNQPDVPASSYFLASSSTTDDFSNLHYSSDDGLLQYNPHDLILVQNSEWDKVDESNPWVPAFNANTRKSGFIPAQMRSKIFTSLHYFNNDTTQYLPIPELTLPTPPPRLDDRPRKFAAPPAHVANTALPSPPSSAPMVPKKPTASLRQSNSGSDAAAPKGVIGTKEEGEGRCGYSDCNCATFVPNQFRKTICLHCRHNSSYHTL